MASELDGFGGAPSQRRTRRPGHGRDAAATSGDGPAAAGNGRSWTDSSFGPARADDVLAALDLGTNNCRLLVARPERDGGFRVIDAFSRIVRLGEGLSQSGHLAEDAIDRTLDALRVCSAKMRRRRVTRFRCVATEACRRAGNGRSFLDRVERETGLALEVISTREEADLALAGCGPLLQPAVPGALVFDIGGGSTELAWAREGARGRAVDVTSMPIGVVTLAEHHGGDRYGDGAYEAMIGEVLDALAPFETAHTIAEQVEAGRVQMVGTSGTVTTLAGVQLDLPRYVRDKVDGVFLDVTDTMAIGRRLAAESFAERAAHPCIGRERADLVVAGCAILEAICRTWPVPRLRVADRGVREGILFGLLAGRG